MDPVHMELLGFAAGAVNLFSSVPQLVANIRNPELACGQSLSRNVLQCSGNALWLTYGIAAGSLAMTTFAGLGSVMAAGLMMQTLSMQRRGSRDRVQAGWLMQVGQTG